MRGPKQPALGAADEELDETFLRLQVNARRLAAHEIVADLPVRRGPELGTRLAEDEDEITARARVARHRAVRPHQQPDHPHDGRGIDGPGRALIVEGDVAARHRCAEHAAGISDAAARFAELIENRGALRVTKVQTVGDTERPGTGAGHVARRLRDGRLAALVRIEPHVAAVAVGLYRNPEVLVAHPDDAGVAAGRDDCPGLHGGVVLFENPPFAGYRR